MDGTTTFGSNKGDCEWCVNNIPGLSVLNRRSKPLWFRHRRSRFFVFEAEANETHLWAGLSVETRLRRSYGPGVSTYKKLAVSLRRAVLPTTVVSRISV